MVAVKSDIEAPSVTQEIPHDHLYKVTGLTNLEKLAQGVCKGYPNCILDIQQGEYFNGINMFIMYRMSYIAFDDIKRKLFSFCLFAIDKLKTIGNCVILARKAAGGKYSFI